MIKRYETHLFAERVDEIPPDRSMKEGIGGGLMCVLFCDFVLGFFFEIVMVLSAPVLSEFL